MIQPSFPHYYVYEGRVEECRTLRRSYWELEPDEYQPILEQHGPETLYAVYPRISEDRALYRPGDDPS
eukprot:1145039-Prorocentrum_lima.AAC.1